MPANLDEYGKITVTLTGEECAILYDLSKELGLPQNRTLAFTLWFWFYQKGNNASEKAEERTRELL